MLSTEKEYFVAVDVQDLFFAAKRAFGRNAKVDYCRLRQTIMEDIVGDSDEGKYCFVAYVITDRKSESFLKVLHSQGYKTVLKARIEARQATVPINLTSEMAVDAAVQLCTNENLVKLVLVSSADFVMPLSRYSEEFGVDMVAACIEDEFDFDGIVKNVTALGESVLLSSGGRFQE